METKTNRVTVDRQEVPVVPPLKTLTISDRQTPPKSQITFAMANEYITVAWGVNGVGTWTDLHGDDLDLIIDSLVELRDRLRKA